MARDGTGEVVRARDGLAHASGLDACILCDAVRGADAHYARKVLCDPERREANARAIADALGFCPAHAAFIAGLDGLGFEITALMRQAVAATRALLECGAHMEDRRLEHFFGAAEACPACAFSERRLAGPLARHVASLRSPARGASQTLRPLCLPHFRASIGLSESSDLLAWARRQIELLSVLAATLEAGAASAVSEAARLIAGCTELPPAAMRNRDSDRANDPSCPVCLAMRRTFEHWLHAAKAGVRIDIAVWAVLPTCPQHLWVCNLSGDDRLAVRASQHAIQTAIHALQQAAESLESEDRKLEIEARSVWYRPKSPAYLLGQRRKAVTAMPRCAACERLAVARDRATGKLLDALNDPRHRSALARGYGLCTKHFARAYLVAPKGGVREYLLAVQAGKLAELERALAPLARESRGSPSEANAWREAVFRLSSRL